MKLRLIHQDQTKSENLYEYDAGSGDYNSPYRFNARELDPETGNYYYGARYYHPKISVWLSVDPLAHNYPSLSPYVFTGNNPIMLVDPDGRAFDFFEKIVNAVKGKGWKSNDRLAEEAWKNKQEQQGMAFHPQVDVIEPLPKKKQPYGEPYDGEGDQQLIETPDAETIGNHQEGFPMRGAPARGGSLIDKVISGLDLLRRMISFNDPIGKTDSPSMKKAPNVILPPNPNGKNGNYKHQGYPKGAPIDKLGENDTLIYDWFEGKDGWHSLKWRKFPKSEFDNR